MKSLWSTPTQCEATADYTLVKIKMYENHIIMYIYVRTQTHTHTRTYTHTCKRSTPENVV